MYYFRIGLISTGPGVAFNLNLIWPSQHRVYQAIPLRQPPLPQKCGLRLLVSCLCIPLFLLTCLLPVFAETATDSSCLTNAQQVRELKPEDAGRNLPVRLRGVITYYDPPINNLFVQDATAGIFVLVDTNMGAGLAAGKEIELEGVTAPGDYAPIISPSVIRVLGPGPLPAPKIVSFDQLAAGGEDSQWVEVRGLVRSANTSNIRYSENRYYLNLLMAGQRLVVSVRDLTKVEADALVDTHVRVRGVCYTRYTMKRQLSTPWIAVPSPAGVVIEEPSSGEPKEVSLAGLAQFNTHGNYGHRLKVTGVVTLQKLDGNLYIQNDEGGLAVRMDQPMRFTPGDEVAVAGYTAIGPYAPSLEDAVVQSIGKGDQPVPVPVKMKTLLGAPEVVEGVLVRVEASLINRVEGPLGQTLILQSSNIVFTAHLEAPHADERFKTIKLGSQVALTGVFVAQPPGKWTPPLNRTREEVIPNLNYEPPESMQILLRSSADIEILREPSWWTLARLLWMLGVMSLVLFAGLAWVVVLDRRVHRQTRIIEEKVKREGVLEERDRIAREFHDTLEQELASITIQLDAVDAQFNSSPETAHRLLGLARFFSRRSLSEARRSVWDLRSHLLENSDLPTALREMAIPLADAAGVEIVVQSTGVPRKLPAVAEHNLLRIAQEAIANALKHSGAKQILIVLAYEPAQIKLRISDDGHGFDIATAGKASSGHFGLLDMRERAEKIGARFSLATQPGHGTEILLHITGVATNNSAGRREPNPGSKLNSPQ
jgi:signal transduction histidine kinase